MLRVRVSTASAEIIETELITAGRRGLECGFEFNSAWDGLAKTVIVNGVVKRDIVLVSDTITVPGECLAREQFPLRIGVYGANGAGEIVIPTIWANFGKILPSARPSGIDPDEVTPDIVAQIQTNSSDALRLAQDLIRRADSGEFDGRDGATGPSGADGRDGLNGNSIWTTTETPMPATGGVAFTQLTGRTGVAPVVGDIVVRSSRYVYQLVEISESGTVFVARLLGDIKGEQGVADTIWRTAYVGLVYPSGYEAQLSDLVGRSGVEPKVGDLVIGPDPGLVQAGDPTHLYVISYRGGISVDLDDVGSIKGDTGATGATGPQGPGVTEDLRAALLQLAQKVAYVDEHGADYYQDLYNALYPSANLLSITATFTQGSTIIYDDSDLDDLRPMLHVVGHYDDNTDAEVTNYDLSGNLTAGSSAVTVSYQSKTTIFTVNVTARPVLSSITATYTQSGTVYDTGTLDSLKANLVVTAVYSDSSTQTVPAADYTLSGTLTAGTSTITVSYGGKTATFTVNVTSTVLFDWDYTEGLNGKIVSVGTVAPTMESDGMLVAGSSTSYSQCAIAPNIEALTESYKAEVTYSDLSAGGKSGNVDFCHYHPTEKRTRLFRFNKNGTMETQFYQADGSYETVNDFVVSASGKMEWEYNATSRQITYSHGQYTTQRTLSTPAEWSYLARIIMVQTGEATPAPSVKIQHIKITKVV